MKDIITVIKAQLEIADEIESDFITLKKGEGKLILKLLEEQKGDGLKHYDDGSSEP